jgi:anti-sigma B factor antagonist
MRTHGVVRVDRASPGVLVVELVGDHDLSNASDLEAALDGGLSPDSGVVVDLSEATFIDSRVIKALFDTNDRLAGHGRQLVLQLQTAGIVMRVLEVTKLTDTAVVVSDRREAVALARQQRETT